MVFSTTLASRSSSPADAATPDSLSEVSADSPLPDFSFRKAVSPETDAGCPTLATHLLLSPGWVSLILPFPTKAKTRSDNSYRQTATAWPRFIDGWRGAVGISTSRWQCE